MYYDDMECPACGIGNVCKKTNKTTKEIFYGCTNWPYCQFSCFGFPKVKIECPDTCKCERKYWEEHPEYHEGYDLHGDNIGYIVRNSWSNKNALEEEPRYAKHIKYGILVMQKSKDEKVYYTCSSRNASPLHVDVQCKCTYSYTQVDQKTGKIYSRRLKAPQFRYDYSKELDVVTEEIYADYGYGDFR